MVDPKVKTKRRTITLTTVVTDVRLDNGRLIAHAVDQDKAGTTIASYDLNVGLEELPEPIKVAVARIVDHVRQWADEA